MKIIAFLFINVLGFELQAAFYSNEISKYFNLFDLDLDEGIEGLQMTKVIDYMIEGEIIKKWESYHLSRYISTGDYNEKKILKKKAHNIASVIFDKFVTEFIFLANGKLIETEDLPILRMLFRMINCRKNNWKCIDKLNSAIKIHEEYGNWSYINPYDSISNKKKNLIKFRDACNELKHYEDQPILALTKLAICFYIKDDPKISDEDLNSFLNQNDDLIFECSEKIKNSFLNVYHFSGDTALFEGKYVGFIHYLH
ncbi:hypothetical protein NCER_102145 [Vairimorpha ceranae BRL01]|uniref:Uncharacterized protein n=2 Tax=Vairimorpha ceranae TaxID=40302 RepID=C4VBH6_VAIC1|nr:hypothetical protein AAJ76_3100031336 [Vairimorpha ceranae]EEQ81426.1 hypothetical protein NCER_102145 [Vairimorpha ceranae BRL01]KAF5139778.1 hypothetical protein G9O61_00g020610 [Vairimorpha ceranae]KKO75132.1 hypothetical protein AAJ76_3100031336 [Vairimorpha ceranae]